MRLDTDRFLDRQLTDNYRCLDFVAEVWAYWFGEDVRERMHALINIQRDKSVSRTAVKLFRDLPAPVDPCFVLMQRPGCDPHVGIYHRGSVLQLAYPNSEFQPLVAATRGFSKVRFFV